MAVTNDLARTSAVRLAARATTWTDDFRLGGAFLFVAGGTILMGIITAEALYPGTFSTGANEISDLGGTRPPEGIVLQPGKTVTAEGRVILDSDGTWRVWPCYTLPGDRLCPDFWQVTFVPVQ